MLIQNDDGTHTGGPLDVILILHDVEQCRYHAAFFEEHPMPGPIKPVCDVTVVRLKSKMHHTGGAPDLAGAQEHARDLATRIVLPDGNVWTDEAHEWDGDLGIVKLVPNWTTS